MIPSVDEPGMVIKQDQEIISTLIEQLKLILRGQVLDNTPAEGLTDSTNRERHPVIDDMDKAKRALNDKVAFNKKLLEAYAKIKEEYNKKKKVMGAEDMLDNPLVIDETQEIVKVLIVIVREHIRLKIKPDDFIALIKSLVEVQEDVFLITKEFIKALKALDVSEASKTHAEG